MASGSEVGLILAAAEMLHNEGINVRCVSMPSWGHHRVGIASLAITVMCSVSTGSVHRPRPTFCYLNTASRYKTW